MNVIVREKAEYHEITAQQMNKHFVMPEWSARQICTAEAFVSLK